MAKRSEQLGREAVAAYRAMGPRHVVEAIEMRAERPLTAAELRIVQRAVEAEFPGMDWDAPWGEIAARFPAATR